MKHQWWGEPTAGEIIWCYFPDGTPRPKPRPALILAVYDDNAPEFVVQVVYGTSQRIAQLYSGEFAIQQLKNPAAYALAGLSYDTKFNLKQTVELPFTTEFFSVPPAEPHGQIPTLGTLHPSMTQAFMAAYRATQGD